MINENILSLNFPLSTTAIVNKISVRYYGFKISNALKQSDCFMFSVYDSKCHDYNGNGTYSLKV
jgi:hypothetical protein